MGLHVSHDCWSGPYRAFHRYRRALARVVGLELERMQGFGGREPWPEPDGDPLFILLTHPDHDGSLPAAVCGSLADRLEGLSAAIDPLLRETNRRWVAGLRRAHVAGEDVVFG